MIGGGYDTKKSMSITYLFLMGGAAASMIKNYKRFLPKTKTLVVDYDLLMATLPMSASGSLFGVDKIDNLDFDESLPVLTVDYNPFHHSTFLFKL